MLPSLSLAVTTLAPSWVAFSMAYWATLPLPLTATVLPLKPVLLCFIISSAKYTQP